MTFGPPIDLGIWICGRAGRIAEWRIIRPAWSGRLPRAVGGVALYRGVENHPAMIERIAAVRAFYGIGGEALWRVRDPFRVAAVLKNEGITLPRCAASSDGLPENGSWLAKPLSVGGGMRRAAVEWRDGRGCLQYSAAAQRYFKSELRERRQARCLSVRARAGRCLE